MRQDQIETLLEVVEFIEDRIQAIHDELQDEVNDHPTRCILNGRLHAYKDVMRFISSGSAQELNLDLR